MKKRKIFSVLFAVVLALSLSLVMAVPVAAEESATAAVEFIEGGDGVAGWSPAQANSGNYSVRLEDGSGGGANAGRMEMVVSASPIADLINPTYFIFNSEAHFRATYPNILLDLDGDGLWDDRLEGSGTATVAEDNWTLVSEVTGYYDGDDSLGSGWDTAPGEVQTLDTWQTWFAANMPGVDVVGVQITDGYCAGDSTAVYYIDDVTIGGVTYDLEPPLPVFDKDFYNVGDEPIVTIYDVAANLDPMAINELTVHVISETDSVGDDVVLSETDSDTGIFDGSFTLKGVPPADREADEIIVSEGDTITLTYLNLTATATVDETSPAFALDTDADADFYADGDTITLTVTLDEASCNVTADFSNIDSEYTEGAETVTPDDGTSYTVTYDISADNTVGDGLYIISVAAEDAAGNPADAGEFTTSASVSLDNTAPVVTVPQATPEVIQPDPAKTKVIFTISVSDGEGVGVATVTIDLESIGGTADQAMVDDASGDDATEDDGVYTCTLDDVSVAEADYPLTVTASDTLGNINDAEAITLRVLLDVTPPVVVSTQVEYPLGAVSARAGDSTPDPDLDGDPVVITAIVTDDLAGVGTVTVDASQIGLAIDEPLVWVDGDTYKTAELIVGDDIAPATYTLPITAIDLAGLDDLDEATVEVVVVISLTGYNIALAEGWNLVSLPLIPDVAAIETVLAALITAETVDWVDTFVYEVDQLVEKKWDPPAILQNTQMSAGQGYWVNMIGDDTLTISGLELPAPPNVPPTYKVYEGWNLIGVKSVDLIPVKDYLGPAIAGSELVAGTLETMYGYDADAGVYTVILVATDLEPGQGYWLAVSADGTIYP